mgnify:CR=1 FL=1
MEAKESKIYAEMARNSQVDERLATVCVRSMIVEIVCPSNIYEELSIFKSFSTALSVLVRG